jgi:hypothetical protein
MRTNLDMTHETDDKDFWEMREQHPENELDEEEDNK